MSKIDRLSQISSNLNTIRARFKSRRLLPEMPLFHKETLNDFKGRKKYIHTVLHIDEERSNFHTPEPRHKFPPLIHQIRLKKACYNIRLTSLLPSDIQYNKIKRSHRRKVPCKSIQAIDNIKKSQSFTQKELKKIVNEISPYPVITEKSKLYDELRSYKIKKKFDSQIIDNELLQKYIKEDIPRQAVKHRANNKLIDTKNNTRRWIINQNYRMYLLKKRYSKQ